MAVARDKNVALPDEPNRLPEAPLPKVAPAVAPLPCCMRIRPIMTRAEITCTTSKILKRMFMECLKRIKGTSLMHKALHTKRKRQLLIRAGAKTVYFTGPLR